MFFRAYAVLNVLGYKSMSNNFINHYVSKCHIREWEDDESGNVFWYNPSTKESKEGKAGTFFHDKISGLAEDERDYVEMLSYELDSIFFFTRCTDYKELKDEDPRTRSALLFAYMRTPSYQMYSEGINGSFVNLKGAEAGRNGIRSGEYMSRLLQIINSGELTLMDLECEEVYCDEGELILPSCPFNIINPYLGDNLSGDYVNLNPFILKGAFFVIPMSPYSACIIYDKSVYKLHGGARMLSNDDVDIINMIGLYNGGADWGVICSKGKEKYVDSLMERIGGKPRRKDIYSRLDTYPFSTSLPTFRFYADAVKNREKNIASPIRKLASKLEEYDKKEMKEITEDNYEDKMHERYLFAKTLIS